MRPRRPKRKKGPIKKGAQHDTIQTLFDREITWQVIILGSVGAFLALYTVHTFVSPLTYNGIMRPFGTYAFIVLFASVMSTMWYLGVKEQIQHVENLRHVPIRVHINGIRGKSTVTRMIGGALREAGMRTLTKTTGKAARVIDWDGNERPILRRGKPNIREQVDMMNYAVDEGVDALVIECMAVHPELQRVAEHKLIHATIGVITNVRADHMDVMGPTMTDVAWHISSTVPSDGTLITAEKTYLPVIEDRARRVNASVMYADPEEIDDDMLKRFSYLNFKDNVAVALWVARMLGIPDDVAIEGMVKARPDPGLMRLYPTIASGARKYTFVNAMGVNDKDSTTVVYRELRKRGYMKDRKVVGLFHARGDRISRTTDFGMAMVKEMFFDHIVLVGKMTNLFVIEAIKAGYRRGDITDLGDVPGPKVLDHVAKMTLEDDRELVVFACGNMVGEVPSQMLDHVEANMVGGGD